MKKINILFFSAVILMPFQNIIASVAKQKPKSKITTAQVCVVASTVVLALAIITFARWMMVKAGEKREKEKYQKEQKRRMIADQQKKEQAAKMWSISYASAGRGLRGIGAAHSEWSILVSACSEFEFSVAPRWEGLTDESFAQNESEGIELYLNSGVPAAGENYALISLQYVFDHSEEEIANCLGVRRRVNIDLIRKIKKNAGWLCKVLNAKANEINKEVTEWYKIPLLKCPDQSSKAIS